MSTPFSQSAFRQSATAFVSGGLLTFAFGPFDIWPLAIACPAILFALWQGAAPRRAAWLGFLFSSATFIGGTYWLYLSIHGFGKAPIPIALILMLGLVAIMGAYCALIGYIAARWLPKSGAWRWLVALPALFVFVEWARGWLMSGFPWLSLGYAGIESWLSGWAPVTGVYGLSLAFAWSAGAAVAIAFGPRRLRIAAAVFVAALWLGGFALGRIEWTRPSGAPMTVALVQGAVPPDEKWERGSRERTFRLYADLTVQSYGSQLIVLPEASLPLLANDLDDYLGPLEQGAEEKGGTLVVGLLREDAGRYFNSLFAVGTKGSIYDKRRLVPFGEFFPVPASVREWMRLMTLPYIDMTPGEEVQPPLDARGTYLAATICYEDSWGHLSLAALERAHLMVNVTNDAWFGDSTAASQHLDIARMRSLEAGRDQMRVANDGITAIIDARGRVLDRLPRFRPGVLKGNVVPHTGLTPYARVGNWPVVTLAALLVVLGFIVRRRHP